MNSNDYKECENPDAQNLTEKTTPYHIDIGRGETHSANEKPSFIHPDRLTSLFKLGMQAQKGGDLNDAIVFFSRIIELDGRNESAIFQRGRLLRCKNNISWQLLILQKFFSLIQRVMNPFTAEGFHSVDNRIIMQFSISLQQFK